MINKTKFKQTEIGLIPEDWNLSVLGNLIDLLTDYHANGSYKSLKSNVELLIDANYAIMIRTTNFEQNNFDSDLRYITKDAYDFLIKSQLKYNDIIMNKIANAGTIYLMPKLKKPVSLGMNLFLIRVNNSVDSKFLFFALKNNENYIKSFAQGSVTKTITKENVRGLKIGYPKEINEQKAIAKILSDLDSKIELNRKINQTLEEIGKTLFKRWFVDFEFPNEKGEPYKSSGGEMVYNEELKKEIPKEWGVDNWNNILNFDRGTEPGSNSYKNIKEFNCVPFYRVGDLLNDSPVYVNKNNNLKYCKFNDVLVSFDGSVGRVKIGLEGSYSSGIRKVSSLNYQNVFIYFLMSSDFIQNIIYTYSEGTTISHASKSLNYMFDSIPKKELIDNFVKNNSVIYNLILNNKREKIVLEKLKNYLLSKLMCGKIRVTYGK